MKKLSTKELSKIVGGWHWNNNAMKHYWGSGWQWFHGIR